MGKELTWITNASMVFIVVSKLIDSLHFPFHNLDMSRWILMLSMYKCAWVSLILYLRQTDPKSTQFKLIITNMLPATIFFFKFGSRFS